MPAVLLPLLVIVILTLWVAVIGRLYLSHRRGA